MENSNCLKQSDNSRNSAMEDNAITEDSKGANSPQLEYLEDKLSGVSAELDILVEQILIAKDLEELKKTTRRNFPKMADAISYLSMQIQ